MNGIGLQLALVGALVVLNAAFAGSEMALVSLREGQLARLEEGGRAGQVLARLARDPNRFLATIQIGITLAGFLASAAAAVTLSEPLVGLLAPLLGGAARPVAIVAVTLALAYVTLVFGELAPKRIAMQRAERWGLLAARPLAAVAAISRPAVWLLSASTDLVVRLLGGDPSRDREVVTEGELRDMVASQPDLSEGEREILRGAFEFADRTLRKIVVPRPRVRALHEGVDAAAAAEQLVAWGHSRAPVHRGDLDRVVGIVHLRDVVAGAGPVGPLALPPLILPETMGALAALRRMQTERQQMAVVVNEHGTAEGIITVEDLVEELVGEIWDEADPDIRGVQREQDGAFVVVGDYPVHDLDELGVDLPEGRYATVAGLLIEHLGRIPDVGQALRIEGWRLEVLEADDRVVRRVRVQAVAPEDAAPT